jgi:hypothetical protein
MSMSPPMMAISGGGGSIKPCGYGSCLGPDMTCSLSISTSWSHAASGSGVASGVGWLGKCSIGGVASSRIGGEGVDSSTNVLWSFSVVVVGPHMSIGLTLASVLASRGGLSISETMGFKGCVSMRLSGPSSPRLPRRDGGNKSSGSPYNSSAPPCPSPNVSLAVRGVIGEGPTGDTGLMGAILDPEVGDVNAERGKGAGIDKGGP